MFVSACLRRKYIKDVNSGHFSIFKCFISISTVVDCEHTVHTPHINQSNLTANSVGRTCAIRINCKLIRRRREKKITHIKLNEIFESNSWIASHSLNEFRTQRCARATCSSTQLPHWAKDTLKRAYVWMVRCCTVTQQTQACNQKFENETKKCSARIGWSAVNIIMCLQCLSLS